MLTLKTGYFCFVFLLSGSLVSLLQLLTLPLWLTSRATFRRLNARLAELYWTGAAAAARGTGRKEERGRERERKGEGRRKEEKEEERELI